MDDKEFPTEFRGVSWDDGWEFDAPCIIYSPITRYGIGGSSGYIENMVEDYCIDLANGERPRATLSESERHEFRARGWSERGMRRRKRAYHVVIKVRWFIDEYGQQSFEMTDIKTTYGPPSTGLVIRS